MIESVALALALQQQAKASSYTVRAGDTLSGIAAPRGLSWPGLCQANRLADCDFIYPGEVLSLTIPAGISSQTATASHRPEAARTVSLTVTRAVQHEQHLEHVRHLQHVQHGAVPQGTVMQGTVTDPGGLFTGSAPVQECIISRESGGNAQIWNASGHYGLYQFAYGTWVAHGGDPALFGHASAAYQTQVFWNDVRVNGYSDWTPSDGCGA